MYYLSPRVANVKLSDERGLQKAPCIFTVYTTGFPANNQSIIEKLIEIHGLQIVK